MMPDGIEVVHVNEGFSGVRETVDDSSEHGSVDGDPENTRQKKKALRHRKGLSPSHSTRHAEISVSLAEVTHDDPSNVDIVDDEAQFAIPTNLFVTGVIHILVGVISLAMSTVLYFANSIIEVYMEASGSHPNSPAVFAFVSALLTFIAGCGLLASLLSNTNFFYRLYPHFLWMIVLFDFVAIGFSLGSWRHLNMNSYARMFESEAMIFCDGNYEYYNILWNHQHNATAPHPRLWSRLEAGLRCCGFNGATDWAEVCDGRVPLSCCRKNSLEECHRKLKSWNARPHNSTSTKNISSIHHLLYQKSCKNVLSLEVKSIQRDWIVFPLIVGLFNLLLMINGNHKTRELTFQLQSAHGQRSLVRFRRHCWNKLKCKSQVKPEKEESDENISPQQSIHQELNQIKFVTDRKSLHDLGFAQQQHNPPIPTNSSVVTVDKNPIQDSRLPKNKLQ